MGVFDQIIEEIRLSLSEDESLSDICFVHAYRVNKRANPIKKTYVTLSLAGVEIVNGAFGDFLGRSNGNDLFGKRSNVYIGLNIYCPKISDGSICSEAFSRICDHFILGDSDINIEELSCKEVKHDVESDSFMLACKLKLNMFVARETQDIEISDIVVQGGA